ncbi:CBS domain-containing protein [Halorussus sp. AFM4]|uniref:CBS domain-containing protein n=1 Tax=Halorussus sp. AFM4 TaxID=3421651 RepID=UPI003EBF4D11
MASVRVGSVFGIPIKLGTSFLLVFPVMAFLIAGQVELTAEMLNRAFDTGIDPGPLTDGAMPWALGLAAALGLFASVLLHELGHSLVARHFGLDIEAITLWFLGGLAQFAELPDDWRHELWISVAGPVVSVALGAVFYGAVVALPTGLPALRFVAGYLAVLNVALAAFNMLPGFPMDGGRVLRAVLSRDRPRLEATRIAASVGKGFAVLLGIAGIFTFNIFWIAIAFFIFVAATGETRQVVVEAALEGLAVRDVMTPTAELDTVSPDESLAELLERMVRERHTGYPVVEGEALVGIVTLEDVQRVDPERRDATLVGDVMSTDLVTVTPDTAATEALTALQREDVGRVLVTDDDGLAGLVSRTDLMTVLEIAQTGRSRALTRRAVEQ